MPFLKLLVSTVSAIGGGKYSYADLEQVLPEAGQVLDPVRGDDDVVLDADAELALDVDARLDGDDVSRLEDVARLRGQPRLLVDVETEAVAEAVAERARRTGSPRSTLRASRVDLDAGDAGADRRRARLLRERARPRTPPAPRSSSGPVANVRV